MDLNNQSVHHLTNHIKTHAHKTRSGFFLLYAGLTLLAAVYLYFFFPETKGKTLEEVEEHFGGVVARKAARRRQRSEKAHGPQESQEPRCEQEKEEENDDDDEEEIGDGTVATNLSPTSRGSRCASALELFMLEGGQQEEEGQRGGEGQGARI